MNQTCSCFSRNCDNCGKGTFNPCQYCYKNIYTYEGISIIDDNYFHGKLFNNCQWLCGWCHTKIRRCKLINNSVKNKSNINSNNSITPVLSDEKDKISPVINNNNLYSDNVNNDLGYYCNIM